MESKTFEKTLGDFSDKDIRDEYIDRFGDPDDGDLGDFTSSDLIDELNQRGTMPDIELGGIEEIADLLAEAARISPHAVRAYEILRDQIETLQALHVRQFLIAGRMAEVA